MSAITTHVLDTSTGNPAENLSIALELQSDSGQWIPIGRGRTDTDGRLATLLPAERALQPGTWRLVFLTGDWFAAQGTKSFHPRVTVAFTVMTGDEHLHVPLLLSPFGYTTYRGS